MWMCWCLIVICWVFVVWWWFCFVVLFFCLRWGVLFFLVKFRRSSFRRRTLWIFCMLICWLCVISLSLLDWCCWYILNFCGKFYLFLLLEWLSRRAFNLIRRSLISCVRFRIVLWFFFVLFFCVFFLLFFLLLLVVFCFLVLLLLLIWMSIFVVFFSRRRIVRRSLIINSSRTRIVLFFCKVVLFVFCFLEFCLFVWVCVFCFCLFCLRFFVLCCCFASSSLVRTVRRLRALSRRC